MILKLKEPVLVVLTADIGFFVICAMRLRGWGLNRREIAFLGPCETMVGIAF